MPANSTPTLRSGRIAATDLPAYCPIKADGTAAAIGETIVGFTESIAKAGSRIAAVCDGSAIGVAGAAITDGDYLQVGLNNTVIKHTGGSATVIGRALNSSAAGDFIEVLLASMGGVASIPGVSEVYNLKASNTTVSRNALASAGFTRSIIQCVGDSFVQGRYSAGNTDVGARKFSWPVLLAALLSGAGIPAQADSVCGWGSVTPSTIDGYVAYDPRVSYTGTVTKYSGIAGLGYEMFQLAAGATLTLTPGVTFDTIDVFYAAKASGATGVFTVSDAGGVKATIDCNVGTAAIQTQTVTLAANSTYVTFTATSTCTISFFVPRTASKPVIDVINCGQAGKPMQQWAPTAAAAPYGTQASLNLLDGSLPAITIFDGWYNDYKSGRTLAQFSADLRAFCTWAKTKGDIWFVNYAKLDPVQVDAATFKLWSETAMRIVIDEFDGVVVDIAKIIPDNATAVAQGIMASDKLHLQKGGHTLTARALVTALLSTLDLA